MFRQGLEYTERVNRIRNALTGIGVSNIYNFTAIDLQGKIKIEGLEELMLSTWSMMQHLMTYLKGIECDYEPGAKVDELPEAIADMARYIAPNSTNSFFISHETEAMERVSRAAYAWLKAFRMLKGQETILPEAFGWDIN